jgi:hypothetical protein
MAMYVSRILDSFRKAAPPYAPLAAHIEAQIFQAIEVLFTYLVNLLAVAARKSLDYTD